MADISNLSNLQAGDPLDYDIYVDAKEAQAPPPKGRYVVRATDQIAFASTQGGFLSAQVDPTVVGPSNEGFKFNFTKISAKPFKRGAATVSQLGDYLRAAGSTARPRTPQEQAEAVEATAGVTLQVDADWEAYCKGCKYTLKGMDRFPKLTNGGYDFYVSCPTCKDPVSEEPVRLRARAKVDRYVSAS
jgi:hypothetical protein